MIFTASNYCTVNKTMDTDIEQIKLSEQLLLSEYSICQSPVQKPKHQNILIVIYVLLIVIYVFTYC